MTFDEWLEQQEAGIASCDHVTFGRKVWKAALEKAKMSKSNLFTVSMERQEREAKKLSFDSAFDGSDAHLLQSDQDVIVKQTAERDGNCTWKCSDNIHEPDTWDGSCGAAWSFIDGGPVENEMNFCPKCGKRVLVDLSYADCL